MQSQSGSQGKDMKRQRWLSPYDKNVKRSQVCLKRWKDSNLKSLWISLCLCGILISILSSWLSASVLYTEQWLRPDIQYPSTDEENVLTVVKSPLSQLQPPSARLSVTAASTEDVISGGPVKLNEQVRTTYSTPSPLRKSTWRQNLWHGTIRRSLLEESIVLIELRFRQWGSSQGQISQGF